MIIFLYGPDTFRSMEKVKELKNKFISEVEGGALNLAELYGEKLTFADFKKEVSTVSFMSSRRMVILKNVIAKSKKENLQEEIINYLKESADSDNVLIFWEENKNGKKKLFKFLTYPQNLLKIYKQEFNLLKGFELRNWIIASVKKKGAQIESKAVYALEERIGGDLWRMNNEIDKIISYDKKISVENVKKMIKARYDNNIFNLTDAIGSRNKKLALKLLKDQLSAGSNIYYILTMMARQYRMLLEVKDYLVKNNLNRASSHILARDLKMHPFVAQKLVNQESLYKVEELKNIYFEIMNIDLKSKQSSASAELLLDILVCK